RRRVSGIVPSAWAVGWLASSDLTSLISSRTVVGGKHLCKTGSRFPRRVSPRAGEAIAGWAGAGGHRLAGRFSARVDASTGGARVARAPPSALEAQPNAVRQLRSAFLAYRDLELQRVRFGLLPRVGRGQHLPITRHRLDHGDRLVGLLVVAQRDFPLYFVEARSNLAELLLRSLADDVEGVAHLDLHAFVRRSVVDPVLADELLAAGGI